MNGTGSIALRVQQMGDIDAGVVLATVAAEHSDDGTFAPKDLEDVYFQVGIPIPSKASNLVASLQRHRYVRIGRARGRWKVTPGGRARSSELLGEMDVAALVAESAAANGALLAGALHSVIPPTFGPGAMVSALADFLADHPFETNVFGMTRFPTNGGALPDPIKASLAVARDVCAAHGLEFHLASDRAIVDDLWTNVAAHMWASHYGVAFFEDRLSVGLNYNLTIEVGGMLMTGRRCALLKDRSIARMPTDLVGQIYRPVDVSDVDSVAKALHEWIRDDLNLGSCASCTS